MKKKIVILGSTGSIGKTTYNIIRKNPKNFEIILLTTNKNLKEIYKQASKLKVKNIIITDHTYYLKAKLKFKNKNIKIFNNLSEIKKYNK